MISNRKLNMAFTRGNTTKTISLENPRPEVNGHAEQGFSANNKAEQARPETKGTHT